MRRPFHMPGYPVVPLLAIAGMACIGSTARPPELGPSLRPWAPLLVPAIVGAWWVKFVMKLTSSGRCREASGSGQ
jgi:hypothetical protein